MDNTIVRFTNIASFDFGSSNGAMFGGQPYFVKAGESLLMPMTIAKHLAKALARQILNQGISIKDDEGMNVNDARAAYDKEDEERLAAKMIVEQYTEEKPKVLSEEERLAEKVKELNEFEPEQAVEAKTFATKKEVIEELKERGIRYDARKTKATLETLLID